MRAMPDDARPIQRSDRLRQVLFRGGGPTCRRLCRLRVEGDEHIPQVGAAIIAANHLSFFDSVVLALAVPRPLSFVGKAEYLDSWKTRKLFPALGMIPVERGSPRRAYRALEVAADVLEADELFAIYPEGTRSPDGALGDGHNGVGHLSVTTGASIIPTGIVGTDRIQPPGARLPRPFGSAIVRFGSPIDPAGYEGSRRERRRQMTSDVMAAISQLSQPSQSEERSAAQPAP
jgi:1-acyl-sn-glycerol-3-phosphate acyltransferase